MYNIAMVIYRKVCPHCNKKFKTDRRTKIYCRDQCARNASKKRKARRQWYVGKHTCRICGKLFEPIDRTSCMCSDKCRKINLNRMANESSMKRYSKNKADWMVIVKEKGMDKCWKCGYDKHFGAIDFHHINGRGVKMKNMGAVFCLKPTMERIKNDLERCIPLCATCHRELHIEEGTMGKSRSTLASDLKLF